MLINGPIILSGIFIFIYAVFFFWYGGSSKPLTLSEAESYITAIKKAQGKQGQQDNAVLAQLRNMAEKDDGKDFYMVNLIKYRKKDSSNPSDGPMEANSRYSKKVVPILLKHGSHPVFHSSVIGSFLKEGSEVDWDTVSIVRYRNERDFIKVATEVSTSGIDIDKWAAIDKTQVFPVRPSLNLIFVRGVVAVVLLVIGFIIHLALIGFKFYY